MAAKRHGRHSRQTVAAAADLRRHLQAGRPRRPVSIRALNRLGAPFADHIPLALDGLIAEARARTGLEDFGEPAVEPPLSVLLDSLNTEAHLHPVGRLIQRTRLLDALCIRLRAQALFEHEPAIERERLPPLIVIAGLQRTGTTLLHRLLASDPRARSLKSWEALDPVPREALLHGEHDPRLARARLAEHALRFMAPEFFAIHPVRAEAPEEEVLLLDLAFMSQAPEAMLHVPSYAHWLEAQDARPAYRLLRQMLKLLQWQSTASHWVLKTPHHLEHLDALLEVFPEAKVVQTHRDPAQTIASFCSMVAHGRAVFSDQVDPREIGQHWYAKIKRMLERSAAARAAAPERFVDVSYAELVADPLAAVERIYSHAGRPLSPAARQAMLHMSRAEAEHTSRHSYRLADFGLSPFTVRRELADYYARHGLTYETLPETVPVTRRAEDDRGPLGAIRRGLTDLRRQHAPTELGSLRCDGVRVLVTGASRGLGQAVANELGVRGAETWLWCRTAPPPEERPPSTHEHLLIGDLSDLSQVHAACDRLRDAAVQLDTVVLNAGLVPRTPRTSAQGFELMFAVHYLASFVLVRRLLDDGVLRGQPGRLPRVVCVSSEAHRSAAPLDLGRLGEPASYGTRDVLRWYGLSKQLQLMFAHELARRARRGQEPALGSIALCPGAVATDIARDAPRWARLGLDPLMRSLFQSPEVAALPVVRLAVAPELEGDSPAYFHLGERVLPAPAVLDPALGAELWQRTERLLARTRRDPA